jgi:ubiquinone biosynthesis protein
MLNIRKINVARSFYRHLKRFRAIVGIMIKFGFEDFISLLKINRYMKIGQKIFGTKRSREISKLTRPVRARMALEELGPTFIKLGQILSTRADLVPTEYIIELSKLQDDVPTFPFEDAKAIIESETGKRIEDIFESIDEKPLAAASISQVHKAVLKNGKKVVIKVKKPGIERQAEVDLEIIYQIANLAEKRIEEFQLLKPTRIVEEFSRTLKKEMNFTFEASNIKQFEIQYKDSSYIIIPKIIDEYSTEKILMLEYIDGIKASETERLRSEGYDTKLVAKRGTEFVIQQIFVHGYFHADPHPGNIFILPGNKICFLDYGMVGRISDREIDDFSQLLVSLAEKNVKKVAEASLNLTIGIESIDRGEFERDIAELIDRYIYLSISKVNISLLIYDLIDTLTRHNRSLKHHLYLMMKALSSMDDLAKQLYPDFDIIEYTQPYVAENIKNRYNAKRIGDEFVDYSRDLLSLMKDLPNEVHSILKQLREGRITLDFRHKGLEDLMNTQNRVSKRMSFSILLASIIIGSSLILLAKVPPYWHDVSILGILGISTAGIMGIFLIISLLWKSKL